MEGKSWFEIVEAMLQATARSHVSASCIFLEGSDIWEGREM